MIMHNGYIDGFIEINVIALIVYPRQTSYTVYLVFYNKELIKKCST